MRYLCLLLLLLTISGVRPLSAQNCDNPRAASTLETNAVRARILVGGDLWWDGSFSAYTVSDESNSPNGNQTHAIYAGALWVGAKGPDGDIRMAAPTYGRNQGRFDYYPGPLTSSGQTSRDTCARWDLTFRISREEVQEFLSSGTISGNIGGWPGVGNPIFENFHGFPLPDRANRLAPFVDNDGDGIYDPRRGDYPAFCGDDAVWCVFNDSGPHRDSNVPGVTNTEIHLLAYAYDTRDDLELDRTTFYEYTVINQGPDSLLDLYLGHWIDSDLGCAENDKVNSIPDQNLFYVYNDFATEATSCNFNTPGYGTSSPVNIFQILRARGPEGVQTEQKLNSLVTLFRGISAPVPGLGTPDAPEEYYDVLSGLTTTGEPLTRSGYGNQLLGSTTRYAFDGGATPGGTPWTYCDEPLPATDIAHVSGMGPYTLAPGQRAEFTLGVTTIFGALYSGPCPREAGIIAAAGEVASIYEDFCDPLRTTGTNPVPAAEAGLRLYPNPTTDRLTFELSGGRGIERIFITDVNGRQVLVTDCADQACAVALSDQNLPGGTYFYRAQTSAGQVVTGKLVYLPR